MRRYAFQKWTFSSPFKFNFKGRYSANFHSNRSLMIQPGLCVQGESGRKYRLLSPLSKSPSNVWIAVDEQDETLEFVIKEPSHHHDASLDWPLFRHEVQMQRRFRESPLIRRMDDFIPQSGTSKPMMVLQVFEKTLWTARNQRPLTIDEIKWIMKAVLLALWTIHREGLVYSDLKMENILLNGFENTAPGDIHFIIARLADCGAITTPSNRKITSIAYRSPEVYFERPWGSSTDIWSWGVIYCHLLEARVDFLSPGIYDSICKGTIEEKAEAVRNAIAQDFSLQSIPFYIGDSEKAEKRNLSPTVQGPQSDDDWWAERLLRKGIPPEEIAFLVEVLNPDPNERLSAKDIICSGFLEV